MALNSQGSKFSFQNAGSPGDWQDLEQTTSIGGPDGTLNLIDVSHLQSTRKEYLPGLADNGTISLECNFTAGEAQMRLFDFFNNTSDPFPCRIKIPTTSAKVNAHTFLFDGIVSKWSLADAVDDKVKLSITIQTTGGVSYAGVQTLAG